MRALASAGPFDACGERGIALLVMLTLLTLCCLTLLLGRLDSPQRRGIGPQKTLSALAQAKQELIADAMFRVPVAEGPRLRLPDIGEDMIHTPTEGQAATGFTGNTKDLSVVGKFPWRTLDIGPLRDGDGECLWYAVSGRFKTLPQTDTFNWDSAGQIDIIDGNGNLIAANLAAMIIAPGPALAAQNRALADPAYLQCGGNYDARNYLDPFDAGQSAAGEANYFAGSNHALAADTRNRRFVLADSGYYNDRFVPIRANDIFDLLIKHNKFAEAVSALLEKVASDNPTVSAGKGTTALTCKVNPSCAGSCAVEPFCENWKEMLFLTQLVPPSPIKIDGVATTNCSRALIFSGRRNAAQKRDTPADKADKKNYLEGMNAVAFNAPTATLNTFSGTSVFNWRAPDADVIRCLP